MYFFLENVKADKEIFMKSRIILVNAGMKGGVSSVDIGKVIVFEFRRTF